MTDAKVVDASAVAAVLFGEPASDAIAARLVGAPLVAPTILGFELSNVCLKKCRQHPEQRAELIAAHRLGGRLLIEELDVDQDDTLALALETGLSTYDASYLWLARNLAAELVTLDRALARAASASIR